MDKSKELASLDDDQLDAVSGGGSNIHAAVQKLEARTDAQSEKLQLAVVGAGLTAMAAALEVIGGKISGIAGK